MITECVCMSVCVGVCVYECVCVCVGRSSLRARLGCHVTLIGQLTHVRAGFGALRFDEISSRRKGARCGA